MDLWRKVLKPWFGFELNTHGTQSIDTELTSSHPGFVDHYGAGRTCNHNYGKPYGWISTNDPKPCSAQMQERDSIIYNCDTELYDTRMLRKWNTYKARAKLAGYSPMIQWFNDSTLPDPSWNPSWHSLVSNLAQPHSLQQNPISQDYHVDSDVSCRCEEHLRGFRRIGNLHQSLHGGPVRLHGVAMSAVVGRLLSRERLMSPMG